MRKCKLLFLVSVLCMAFITHAQVSLPAAPATSYTENFDGMGSGTTPPTGWTARNGASASARGTVATLSTNAPSATTGAFNNYVSASPGSGRSLGVRQTGSLGDPGAAFELEITNTSGRTGFSMSIDHLVLDAQPRVTTWTVQYSTNGGTAWTTVGTYAATASTTANYSFGTGLDNKASTVHIRVVTLAASSGSGNRDSYGIDDFSLSWTNAATSTITTTGTLSAFSQTLGTPSAEQSYTVSGTNLTNNITVTPPSNYEVSLTDAPFTPANPITLTQSGGTVATTTIYVRRNALSPGSNSGNIANASSGATTKNVAVSGSTTQISAATDYFRSNVAAGNWNAASSWQSSPNNTNWITSTIVPDETANDITIRNTHTITATADITTDQTIIENGGALNVDPGITLTVNNGTGTDIDIANGGRLVFRSDATGSGRIAAVPAGAVVNGNVTVERFIPSLGRKYRYVASPVSQSLEDAWHQQVHITGPGTGGTVCPDVNSNGFDWTLSNSPSMFTYDETQAAGSKWVNVPNTAITLTPGTGYRMNIRGPKSDGCGLIDGTNNTQNAVTLSATGTLTTGDVAVTLNGGNGGYGYTLVGNPYPGEINWNNATWETMRNTNSIENSYVSYFPCNTATTANANFYSVCLGGSGIISNNCGTLTNPDIIASGQAFFVRYNNGAGTTLPLTNFFQESFKSSTTQTGMFKTTTVTDRIKVTFRSADTNRIDECFVRFAIGGDYHYDLKQDATAISSSSFSIAGLKDNDRLAIQTRPLLTAADTVALDVAGNAGNYMLHFAEYDQFTTADIYVVDNYLHTIQDVKNAPYYAFTINADVASKGRERFELVFTNNTPTSIKDHNSSITLSIYPNPVNNELNLILNNTGNTARYNVVLSNIQGQQVSRMDNITPAGRLIKLNTSALPQGVYAVDVTDSKGNRSTAKFIK